jgi:hypothetical protein
MDSESINSNNTQSEISVDQIAAYLLNNSFLLTALELHQELIERGTELPLLKNFFQHEQLIKQLDELKEPSFVTKTDSNNNIDSLANPQSIGGSFDQKVSTTIRKTKKSLTIHFFPTPFTFSVFLSLFITIQNPKDLH